MLVSTNTSEQVNKTIKQMNKQIKYLYKQNNKSKENKKESIEHSNFFFLSNTLTADQRTNKKLKEQMQTNK